jgi:hypothetical protein
MKPTTPQQEMVYARYRNDCTEKNAIRIALWHERRFALDLMTDYFRNLGERHGRT